MIKPSHEEKRLANNAADAIWNRKLSSMGATREEAFCGLCGQLVIAEHYIGKEAGETARADVERIIQGHPDDVMLVLDCRQCGVCIQIKIACDPHNREPWLIVSGKRLVGSMVYVLGQRTFGLLAYKWVGWCEGRELLSLTDDEKRFLNLGSGEYFGLHSSKLRDLDSLRRHIGC